MSVDAARTAGLARRGLALALDLSAAALLVVVGFLVGAFDSAPLRPPADWFWTEWWFKFWLDDPSVFTRPMAAFVTLALVWITVWEALTDGGTPGDRLARIRVVGLDGHRPGPVRHLLRLVGSVINIATLGLGWLWVFVSPTRRGWHDYLSGTWVIVRR